MPYTFTEVDPSDYYTALSSYFKSDMSEVAHFTILDGDLKDASIGSGSKLNLDILVTNVITTLAEYTQIEPHIGDTFSLYFRGKSPLFVNMNCNLIDTGMNYGKAELITLYRDVLRVKAVAKTGIAPVLIFPGISMQCAVCEMSISESSESQTVASVTMRLIILKLMAYSQSNKGATSVVYDYTQSSDLHYLSENEQSTAVAQTSGKDYYISALPSNYKEL